MPKKSVEPSATTDTERPTGELALVQPEPVHPGSSEVDQTLVDQAVADLNRIYVSKNLETACALGEYIVERFFGGDLDAASGLGPTSDRHQSFRALADREDLHVSHAHLWVCVKVVGQLRHLPEDIATALPISHHRRLLTVKDEDTKIRLAKKAVEEGLTVKALEAEVAKVKAKEQKGEKRGRKALPPWLKAVNMLHRLDFGAEDLSDEVLDGLGEEKTGELLGTIDEKIKALEALKARIAKTGQ